MSHRTRRVQRKVTLELLRQSVIPSILLMLGSGILRAQVPENKIEQISSGRIQDSDQEKTPRTKTVRDSTIKYQIDEIIRRNKLKVVYHHNSGVFAKRVL